MSEQQDNLNTGESRTIKEMREMLDVHKTEAKAALAQAKEAEAKAAEFQAKLTNIEREKMDELERTRAEKQELEQKLSGLDSLKDEVGKYATALQSQYERLIAQVPEDKRDAVLKLTSQGSWGERLEAVSTAAEVLNVRVSTPVVTASNPGAVLAPTVEQQRPSMSDVAKTNGVMGVDWTAQEVKKNPLKPTQ